MVGTIDISITLDLICLIAIRCFLNNLVLITKESHTLHYSYRPTTDVNRQVIANEYLYLLMEINVFKVFFHLVFMNKLGFCIAIIVFLRII